MSEENPASEAFVATDYARDADPVLRLGTLTIHGDRVALFSALARAQAKFEPISRSRTVTVQPREGRAYTFDYAPLENVIAATLPAMNSEGLAWIASLADSSEAGEADLHTLLTHESGAFLHVVERLPPVSKAQERGSQVTYRRRYQFQCLTGTSPEVDDDGNAADGNTVQDMKNKGPRREAPAAPPKKTEPKPAQQSSAGPVTQADDSTVRPVAKSEPPPPPKDNGGADRPDQHAKIKELFAKHGFTGKGKAGPFVQEILGIPPKEISTAAQADRLIAALEDDEVRERTVLAIGGLS